MFNLFKKIKQTDLIIYLLTAFLLIWSVINIYSASYHEYSNLYIKQIVFVSIAFFIITFLPFLIEYRKFGYISFYLYLVSIILLILVKLFGVSILGAKRWINLGFFQLQPSEVAKFSMIIFSAYFISNTKLPLSFKDFLKIMGLSAIPFMLIYSQPDLGSAILVVLPVLVMVFLAKFNIKYIIGFVLTGIILSPFIWTHLKDYQKNRIIAFLNPESDPKGTAYHIIQSKIAIGSGMLTGKGYLQGSQSKYYFLPEQHTDFIYATIGEEWGFVVSFLILTVYFILSLRIFYIGMKTNELFGKFLCYGIASIIGFQAFINIAMNVGMAPVVGVPLPFLSYGGTALIMFSLMIMMVLNIEYINKKEGFRFHSQDVLDY
ncbi:MAG: rod shape-determining protein RodA [Sulfurihydrogenibium sp.]|jgi:rod shape determining protein RodA|nr:rod shape-determining protein RodA [Sulfurihydrogenibium sp.]